MKKTKLSTLSASEINQTNGGECYCVGSHMYANNEDLRPVFFKKSIGRVEDENTCYKICLLKGYIFDSCNTIIVQQIVKQEEDCSSDLKSLK